MPAWTSGLEGQACRIPGNPANSPIPTNRLEDSHPGESTTFRSLRRFRRGICSASLGSERSCLLPRSAVGSGWPLHPQRSYFMQLGNLLESQDIDQDTVLVLRHRPKEPELRRVLPWLVAQQPEGQGRARSHLVRLRRESEAKSAARLCAKSMARVEVPEGNTRSHGYAFSFGKSGRRTHACAQQWCPAECASPTQIHTPASPAKHLWTQNWTASRGAGGRTACRAAS